VPLYTGLFLSLLALAYWQYADYQDNLLTESYIIPLVKNDFYFINNHKINEISDPNQKYRPGKVVSINNGIVSMIDEAFTYKSKLR
jgi:hypothetical protein